MIDTHRKTLDAAEAVAVAHDHKIVAEASALRIAKGKPRLTPEQEANMLRERAARRAKGT